MGTDLRQTNPRAHTPTRGTPTHAPSTSRPPFCFLPLLIQQAPLCVCVCVSVCFSFNPNDIFLRLFHQSRNKPPANLFSARRGPCHCRGNQDETEAGFTVIIGCSKGHPICSLMQMTSLYILDLFQKQATFNYSVKTTEKEPTVTRGRKLWKGVRTTRAFVPSFMA